MNKEEQKKEKHAPQGARVTKTEQKGCEKGAKGSQKNAKGNKKGAKECQKGAKGRAKNIQKSMSGKGRENVTKMIPRAYAFCLRLESLFHEKYV